MCPATRRSNRRSDSMVCQAYGRFEHRQLPQPFTPQAAPTLRELQLMGTTRAMWQVARHMHSLEVRVRARWARRLRPQGTRKKAVQRAFKVCTMRNAHLPTRARQICVEGAKPPVRLREGDRSGFCADELKREACHGEFGVNQAIQKSATLLADLRWPPHSEPPR